ncbi:invasion associated locus B family protein [Beijerinckia sp. L45]|uniref:invasion associated locus B family protein n=1 Tax=Beijerinckia sp. L45 TaxID=1641855 RepID=UPI00131A7555|nr:invasion associated locus B family protein [Beijerinckia sp. L45]
MSHPSKRLLTLAVLGSCLLASPLAAAPPKKKAPAPAADTETPAAAPAADAPAAAPAPAAGQQAGSGHLDLVPTQNDWTKVCGKDQTAGKEVCYTTRDFSAAANQPPVLALAVYDVKGDDTKIIRMLMPIGLMLRPGFRFSVDKGASTDGAFEICFPNGCFAEAKVKSDTTTSMKKATALNVSVRNQKNEQVDFAIPLAGFGKAFDGPAIDPKVLQEQQAKLQAELQKRAEDERKKLESQQPAAASPTGGAAIAPPAAAK